MSSTEEFNDFSFVRSLPVRKGLEESPKFAIPNFIMLQLFKKKIKSTKQVPPKLVERVPVDLTGDAKGGTSKTTKETVFVNGEGDRTRCIGEECAAETEVRDPMSLFAEAAPYQLVGEYSTTQASIHKDQLLKKVVDLNLQAISKLQSFVTSKLPQIREEHPEFGIGELKEIVKIMTREKAKEMEREFPISDQAVDQVVEAAYQNIESQAARNPVRLRLDRSQSPDREPPVQLSR